jgi:hypothetical protein
MDFRDGIDPEEQERRLEEVTPKKAKPQQEQTDKPSSKKDGNKDRKAKKGRENISKEEAEHEQNCKTSDCSECRYIRNGHKWSNKLPCITTEMGVNSQMLPPEVAAVVAGSWLVRQAGEKFALGCIACKLEFESQNLVLCNFTKHHRSGKHVSTILNLCGQLAGPTGKTMAGSPSYDEFLKVWDSATSGVAPWQGVPGVGSQRKVNQMRYCLAQGIFELDREFLSKGLVRMSVARDEREGRLLLRYTACCDQLEVRRGLIWKGSKVRGTGDSITAATAQGFKNLATRYCGAPDPTHGDPRVKPYTNVWLVKKMIHSTEVLKTDSASNEIVSCREMFKEGVDIDGETCKFSNMMIGRDKAHGSRRTRS